VPPRASPEAPRDACRVVRQSPFRYI